MTATTNRPSTRGASGSDDVRLLSDLLGQPRAAASARDLLRCFGDLPGLGQACPERIEAMLGRGRARRVLAALRIAQRLRETAWRPCLSSPQQVVAQVADLARRPRETIVALSVDSRCGLIARETVAVGSLNVARAMPRDVLAGVLRNDATGLVLAHNHPSGIPSPSEQDRAFTRAIAEACELLGLILHDHVVVATSGFVSMREQATAWPPTAL